ncbi:PREDICTED: uncharacterized protein LOC104607435 [Nelumbo nucifera]|uniref:Uncharacterized protein LOC104607435 n=2 Tax=Nelumbo nucifera TaxID=4432 RepID=A0A1U8AU00_NELNU|nr:PREDICTED: uncharacterized protein LOC104607435 [Nelumbo nucifera]DAD41394.1 TPA_asm: hypothetical protein HUJ06_015717 [Nelumbo nucifera]
MMEEEGEEQVPSGVPSLNSDVYSEILYRLNVKSISRFKSVSKEWNAIISSPSFALNYSKRKPSITGFFYSSSRAYKEKLRYVSIDHREDDVSDPSSCLGFLDNPAILRNSCNGLLHWSCSRDLHYISNPLTRKSVPVPWTAVDVSVFFSSGIAFDPSVSLHFELVVLMLQFQSGEGHHLHVKTFRSETGQWGETKKILTIDPQVRVRLFPISPYQGVYLNGCLHWEMNDNALLVYNVNQESAYLMELPPLQSSSSSYPQPRRRRPFRFMGLLGEQRSNSLTGCLGESGGCLHWCRLGQHLLQVWSLQNNEHSSSVDWIPKYTVYLDALLLENSQTSGAIIKGEILVLGFLHDCRGVLLSQGGKVLAYHFGSNLANGVTKIESNVWSVIQPYMFFPFVHSSAVANCLGLFLCQSI